MKNEILDDIFNDKLRDQLEEGEVIILGWKTPIQQLFSICRILLYHFLIWNYFLHFYY